MFALDSLAGGGGGTNETDPLECAGEKEINDIGTYAGSNPGISVHFLPAQ